MPDNLQDIQEFRDTFLNEIALEAQADIIFNEQRFIERAVNIIAEDGLIDASLQQGCCLRGAYHSLRENDREI